MTAEVESPIEGMIGKLVDGYIKLRNKKAEMKARHDSEMDPINAMLDRLEVHLLTQMQAQGVTAYKTADGTAYTQKRTSATVADRDTYLAWVRETENWQMLESRVSKVAVDEYVAANSDLPPGVNYRSEMVVNVRRA